MWCAKSVVRKLTSTVDASPFFVANCCFVADKNSWILVLHIFLAKVFNTFSIAASLNVSMLGNFEASAALNVSWYLFFSASSLSCATCADKQQ